MRKIISSVFLALSLVSCQDSISLDGIAGGSRMLMYAFPTDADTIDIRLSTVQPINGRMPQLDVKCVTCTTNGVSDKVIYAGTTVEKGFPICLYRAVGSHHCGDEICIKASAEGLPDIDATTRIPQRPAIDASDYSLIYNGGELRSQLKLSFHDLPDVDYYAVRIKGRHVPHSDYVADDTWLGVETSAEPLLNNYSGAKLDLGTSNDFYHNMYIFDDSSFGNAVATLRMPITYYYRSLSAYQSHLLALSREYYLMLKSLNDIGNNDLAQYGLAFAFSSYTNVRGGCGCVAGYAADSTAWQKKYNLRYVVRCDNPDAYWLVSAPDLREYNSGRGSFSHEVIYGEDKVNIQVRCDNDPNAKLYIDIYYEDRLKATKSGYGFVEVEAWLRK